MAGVGHTWLAHAADNGFPSDHATLTWSWAWCWPARRGHWVPWRAWPVSPRGRQTFT